jgi:hypothetical protein
LSRLSRQQIGAAGHGPWVMASRNSTDSEGASAIARRRDSWRGHGLGGTLSRIRAKVSLWQRSGRIVPNGIPARWPSPTDCATPPASLAPRQPSLARMAHTAPAVAGIPLGLSAAALLARTAEEPRPTLRQRLSTGSTPNQRVFGHWRRRSSREVQTNGIVPKVATQSLPQNGVTLKRGA